MFLRESQRILTDWDTYSDQHTDPDSVPHDEDEYGRRQRRKDADTWRAFGRVHLSAKTLIARAEADLARLPVTAITPRWPWQFSVLAGALERLDVLRDEWFATLDGLPASAQPGTSAYDEAIAERDAEAWSYLDDWSGHGQALLDISGTAQQSLSPSAPVPALGRTTSVRR